MTGATEISASLVKELRDQTGAGMMACKQALQETGGDLEAARTLLRERGMAAAGKRADRATTEGLVGVIVDADAASIVGIGCETEPVSRNDAFQAFAERVLRAVHGDGPSAVEGFEPERTELIAQLGENIVIAGAERLEGGTLAAYVHPPANKIGVVVKQSTMPRWSAFSTSGTASGTGFAPSDVQSAFWMSVSCMWAFSPFRSATDLIGFDLWPKSCQPFTAQMYRKRPRSSQAFFMSS